MLNKKHLYTILFIIFILAIAAGKFYQQYRLNHSVAIRIGMPENELDYDLKQSINFISYQIEKQGYNVVGKSYAGNLYPPHLNQAKINIFVRGFTPFYDVRISKDKTNIFYVERPTKLYQEEFVGYDAYWISQAILKKKLSSILNTLYIPSNAQPRPLLNLNEEYDILYIYEAYNPQYTQFLKEKYPKHKIYGGTDFGNLPFLEQHQELSKAKLVVYEMLQDSHEDIDFIPFAVYDIIAYGRPCLTNFKPSLTQKFGSNIYLFNTPQEQAEKTFQILNMPNHIREQKAKDARASLKYPDIPLFPNF